MVIDTSAFVAIFFAEPERQSFRNAILAADTRLVSAVNTFETGIVLESRIGEGAGREFDLFVMRSNIDSHCGGCRAGRVSSFGMASIWERASPGGAQFWRLFRVRPIEVIRGTDPGQRHRFRAYRY